MHSAASALGPIRQEAGYSSSSQPLQRKVLPAESELMLLELGGPDTLKLGKGVCFGIEDDVGNNDSEVFGGKRKRVLMDGNEALGMKPKPADELKVMTELDDEVLNTLDDEVMIELGDEVLNEVEVEVLASPEIGLASWASKSRSKSKGGISKVCLLGRNTVGSAVGAETGESMRKAAEPEIP
ncbi:hypothetical protein JR316_0011341 [Psilocybe cubensis]|uniref:Uncharacterized protein n=1 Tax=Psilocybe cubensis TaxID=181762 RepID=A0ACB8GK66_PSICU|nr:hypothetical protein JR316_0011341 [Psilocybe cubensis]KAH9475782.1 hypothetical protein JR316_0011341 [Psilocybe cubensis]